MLSCLIKDMISKLFLIQTKIVESPEKEARQELAQDLARADDDGFAVAKRMKVDSVTNQAE